MTRYIIKLTCEATKNNPSFKGEQHVYYYGKEETEVSDFECMGKHIGEPVPYMVKKYGFCRKSSATRALNMHKEISAHENARGLWKDTVELIEVEVE